MPIHRVYHAPGGNRLIIRTLQHPEQPMMNGTCPVCLTSVTGYTGGGGQICMLNIAGSPVQDPVNTNWGHLNCIEKRFDDIVEQYERTAAAAAKAVGTPQVVEWHSGTQREMILFMQKVQPKSIVVNTDTTGGRMRAKRYHWRIATEEFS